jgi:hypothetical protein
MAPRPARESARKADPARRTHDHRTGGACGIAADLQPLFSFRKKTLFIKGFQGAGMTRREQREAQLAKLAELRGQGWRIEAELFLLRAVVLVRPTVDGEGKIGVSYKTVGPAGQGTEILNRATAE